MTPEVGTEKATQAPSVMETLINIVPTNPVSALAEADTAGDSIRRGTGDSPGVDW